VEWLPEIPYISTEADDRSSRGWPRYGRIFIEYARSSRPCFFDSGTSCRGLNRAPPSVSDAWRGKVTAGSEKWSPEWVNCDGKLPDYYARIGPPTFTWASHARYGRNSLLLAGFRAKDPAAPAGIRRRFQRVGVRDSAQYGRWTPGLPKTSLKQAFEHAWAGAPTPLRATWLGAGRG